MMDWMPNSIHCVGMPDDTASLSTISEYSQNEFFLPNSLICLPLGREKWHRVKDSYGGSSEWGWSFTEEVGGGKLNEQQTIKWLELFE